MNIVMRPTLNEVNILTDDKPASQQLSFSSFKTLQLDLKDLFNRCCLSND